MKRKRYVYMAVTADEFENIIAECESPEELADIIGVNVNTIRAETSDSRKRAGKHTGRYRGYRIVKVEDV